MATYKFVPSMDAEARAFKLSIVDITPTPPTDPPHEHPEYGQVNIALDDILTIVTGAMIPSGTMADSRTLKIREVIGCDPDTGSKYYFLALCGAPYTKP